MTQGRRQTKPHTPPPRPKFPGKNTMAIFENIDTSAFPKLHNVLPWLSHQDVNWEFHHHESGHHWPPIYTEPFGEAVARINQDILRLALDVRKIKPRLESFTVSRGTPADEPSGRHNR